MRLEWYCTRDARVLLETGQHGIKHYTQITHPPPSYGGHVLDLAHYYCPVIWKNLCDHLSASVPSGHVAKNTIGSYGIFKVGPI